MSAKDDDLLSYLGIQVPSDKKSVVPSKVATVESSRPCAVAVQSLNQPPTKEANHYMVRKHFNNGVAIDYAIYDSVVPCNTCYNIKTARTKQQAQRSPTQHVTSVQELDEKERLRQTMQRLDQRRKELAGYYEQHMQAVGEKKQKEKLEKQKERDLVDSACKQAATVESNLRQQRHEVMRQWNELLKRDVAEKAQRKEKENDFQLAPPFPAAVNKPLLAEKVQACRESLRSSWKKQIDEQHAFATEQKSRFLESEKLLNQQIISQKEVLTHKYAEFRRQLLEAKPWAKLNEAQEERARQQQQQKLQERERVAQAVRSLNEQLELVRMQQLQRRQRQLEELEQQAGLRQQRLQRCRQEQRSQEEHLQQCAERKIPKRVLLRCPVSDHLLPPEAFNCTVLQL